MSDGYLPSPYNCEKCGNPQSLQVHVMATFTTSLCFECLRDWGIFMRDRVEFRAFNRINETIDYYNQMGEHQLRYEAIEMRNNILNDIQPLLNNWINKERKLKLSTWMKIKRKLKFRAKGKEI